MTATEQAVGAPPTVRGVQVTRPDPQWQGGDPERPIRLAIAGVAYADLNADEARQVVQELTAAIDAPSAQHDEQRRAGYQEVILAALRAAGGLPVGRWLLRLRGEQEDARAGRTFNVALFYSALNRLEAAGDVKRQSGFVYALAATGAQTRADGR